MFINITMSIISGLLTGFCIVSAFTIKKFRIAFLAFGLAFFGLTVVIAGYTGYGSVSNKEHSQFGPEKAEAMLSLYIQDGTNVSESYYLEVTSDETYKFCYFCNDGANIAKMELPCSKCELINSNDDLPHRVELYRDGDNITLARFFIPDDANTIQFDANND